MTRLKYVVNFDRLGMGDTERVGGKNASLGEMIVQLSKAGIRVPGGFATTAEAFREFLAAGGLAARIETRMKGLDPDDVEALGRCGAEIRGWIEATPFPKQLEAEIAQGLRELTGGDESVSVAVRSSATAEDLPDASFAGQQETFLNIRGLANDIEEGFLLSGKGGVGQVFGRGAGTHRHRYALVPSGQFPQALSDLGFELLRE